MEWQLATFSENDIVTVHEFVVCQFPPREFLRPQRRFVATLWGAVIEWLLPASVGEITPDMETPISVFAELVFPLNLAPSNILRPSRTGFTEGRRNPS